ncbi:LapA family protein [Anabaena azotica]|uniref:LapA family protein n=1 Tax=Anabaena azotica FACHB-119 TaxID=947527 RepID=A0ABR8D0W9_9NOST|nr:LapA family protein [Anabaena azotica]MBD2500819.1 LapA family protein [Anabaena azotica FACHB-119]
MAVIRLTLLVAVLGGLTLLLVQNLSPALPLVFLGMRSQPLPLALWILFSTAAGAGTSLLITSLFRLSSYFGGQPRQVPPKSTTSRRSTANRKEEFTPPPPSKEPANKTDYASNDEFDDWETNSADDDWDIEEKPRNATTNNSQSDSFSDSSTYERPQQPKSGTKSGSTYSYSYREPKNTAAGKTESVYDADYRVIIPPYQPPPKDTANDDDDDWGFDDDE